MSHTLSNRIKMGLVAALCSATLVGPGGSAAALGANCSSTRITTSGSGASTYRISRTICSSVNSDTKVRSKLAINNAFDSFSSFYQSPNVTMDTSPPRSCFDCVATHELRSR